MPHQAAERRNPARRWSNPQRPHTGAHAPPSAGASCRGGARQSPPHARPGWTDGGIRVCNTSPGRSCAVSRYRGRPGVMIGQIFGATAAGGGDGLPAGGRRSGGVLHQLPPGIGRPASASWRHLASTAAASLGVSRPWPVRDRQAPPPACGVAQIIGSLMSGPPVRIIIMAVAAAGGASSRLTMRVHKAVWLTRARSWPSLCGPWSWSSFSHPGGGRSAG